MQALPLVSLRSDDACYLTADGLALFVHTRIDGSSETTLEWDAGAEVVSAVVHEQDIVVVDRASRLTVLDLDTLQVKSDAMLTRVPLQVVVSKTGRVAVVNSYGVQLFGKDSQSEGLVDLRDATCAAFDAKGDRIAVGSRQGEVVCCAADGRRQGGTTLDFPLDSITWHASGKWLVSGERLKMLDRDCTKASAWGKHGSSKKPMTGVVASPDGMYIGYRVGDTTVRVVDFASGTVVQELTYPNGFAMGDGTFELGQVDFGSNRRFVVALGSGEANLLDPTKDGLFRSDPPRGRSPNRWMVHHSARSPRKPVVSKGAKWTFFLLALPILGVIALLVFVYIAIFVLGG